MEPRGVRQYTSSGGVVIEASHERVLTLLRPKRPDSSGNPEIRLPKGHVAADETRLQAAIREVNEETGLSGLAILADLGHQVVEFEWEGIHYIRDESYFLMSMTERSALSSPEAQFQPLWLTWEEALSSLTYEAERVWVQRAKEAAFRLAET
jgi:8-oxo-dGTP pyrophosphatase MutT (NUDIX family)